MFTLANFSIDALLIPLKLFISNLSIICVSYTIYVSIIHLESRRFNLSVEFLNFSTTKFNTTKVRKLFNMQNSTRFVSITYNVCIFYSKLYQSFFQLEHIILDRCVNVIFISYFSISMNYAFHIIHNKSIFILFFDSTNSNILTLKEFINYICFNSYI